MKNEDGPTMMQLANWLDEKCSPGTACREAVRDAAILWRHQVEIEKPAWLDDDLSRLTLNTKGEFGLGGPDTRDTIWLPPGKQDASTPAFSALMILQGFEFAAEYPSKWSMFRHSQQGRDLLGELLVAYPTQQHVRTLWQWSEFAPSDLPSMTQLATQLRVWLGELPALPTWQDNNSPAESVQGEPPVASGPGPADPVEETSEAGKGPTSGLAGNIERKKRTRRTPVEQETRTTVPAPDQQKSTRKTQPVPVPESVPVEVVPTPPALSVALLDKSTAEIMEAFDIRKLRKAELPDADMLRFAEWAGEHLRQPSLIGLADPRVKPLSPDTFRISWKGPVARWADRLILGVCAEAPSSTSNVLPSAVSVDTVLASAPPPNSTDIVNDDWQSLKEWCVAIWAVIDFKEGLSDDVASPFRVYSHPVVSKIYKPTVEPERKPRWPWSKRRSDD